MRIARTTEHLWARDRRNGGMTRRICDGDAWKSLDHPQLRYCTRCGIYESGFGATSEQRAKFEEALRNDPEVIKTRLLCN